MSSVAVTVRLLTTALIGAVALDVATVVGFVEWLDTGDLAAAVLRAGVAFGGAAGLGLAVWGAVRAR